MAPIQFKALYARPGLWKSIKIPKLIYMKISKKVSIVLVGVQCVLTGLSVGFANYSFSNYVDDVEKSNALKIESRFNASLNAQKILVSNRVNDWSNWDDAYNFIAGKQPDFLEKNINDVYLLIAKLNHIVFFKKNGELVHGSSTFAPFEKWEPTDTALSHIFSNIIKLHPRQNTADLIKFKDRILIWSATPVVDSEGKREPNGYLIMARELNQVNAPDFEDYFGHQYSLNLDETTMAEPVTLEKKSQSDLLIRFPLMDSQKNMLGAITVPTSRSENLVAIKTKTISLIILLGLVFVGVGITYVLIHLLIIRRLGQLTHDIPEVLAGKSELLTYENSEDEISDFARFFNTSVKLFHEESAKANEAQLALSHSAQLSSIGEIAGSIVHEIKNPLTVFTVGISLMKKLITQGDFDPDKFTPKLDQLATTTKKITSIINTVSRFSRKDTSDYHQKIQIQNIIDDALFLMTEKIRKQNVKMITQYKPETEICCNPALLALVIGNLLSNSLDAITEIKDPWIEVGFNETELNYEIWVKDCGPGLPAEFIERMRQPFFTTKPQGKGTGLGLSFSRKVMSDHNGAIEYDSTCSNTKFVLRFPKQIVQNEFMTAS
jgi:signal transduction histidine kinase